MRRSYISAIVEDDIKHHKYAPTHLSRFAPSSWVSNPNVFTGPIRSETSFGLVIPGPHLGIISVLKAYVEPLLTSHLAEYTKRISGERMILYTLPVLRQRSSAKTLTVYDRRQCTQSIFCEGHHPIKSFFDIHHPVPDVGQAAAFCSTPLIFEKGTYEESAFIMDNIKLRGYAPLQPERLMPRSFLMTISFQRKLHCQDMG